MKAPPPDFGTKLCRGPLHGSPTRLPLSDFYRRASGKPFAQCRLCSQSRKLGDPSGPHGYVPVVRVYLFARELVERCGTRAEASRRYGLSRTALQRIEARTTTYARAGTVARLLLALSEQRKEDRRNGNSERFLAARRAQAVQEERMNRLAGY